jgi:predicted DNA-binding protein
MGGPHLPISPFSLTRPIYDWINRVNRKHADFTSIEMSPEQKQRLTNLVRVWFISSNLYLDGLTVSQAQIARIVSLSSSEAGKLQGSDLQIAELFSLILRLESIAQQGDKAVLTPRLLCQLNDPLNDPPTGFRSGPVSTGLAIRAVSPERISASVEAACQWFAAKSMRELHPVEQAAIAHLRLIEIQPFKNRNELTARAAASLFTMRSGLPPIIFKPDQALAYRAALGEGLRMDTRPMVELIAEAIEACIDDMITLVRQRT